jgi:integrase
VLRVPNPKGGRAFDLPLSDKLVELLEQRKEENKTLYPDTPWIFPTHDREGKVIPIREARTDVGVKWTPHDLRRTFITVAESLDISAYALKALVNHSQPKGDVTAGYMSIDVERLRDPMQRITDKLALICEGDDDNVVKLDRAKG